jgi:hypothetical protein
VKDNGWLWQIQFIADSNLDCGFDREK